MKIPYKLNPFGKADRSWKPYGPTNGLVFYAPLSDSIDPVVGGSPSVTKGSANFGSVNGLNCLMCNGNTRIIYQQTDKLPTSNSPRSLSIWISRNTYVYSWNFCCGFGYEDSDTFSLAFNSHRLTFYSRRLNKDIMLQNYSENNAWIHVVLCFDGTIIKSYINGVYRTSSSSVTFSTSNGPVYLGFLGTQNDYDFKGNATAYRIYDRELTQEEVTELYNEFNPRYEITASDQTWSSLTPAQIEGYDIVYSCPLTPSFEIISGSLPSSITFNTSTGHFQGKALTDADHTYNLVIRIYGDDIITKDINMTINTSATSRLTVSTPQTFSFITEKINDTKDIEMATTAEAPSFTISSGTLPSGVSIYRQGNGLKISSAGTQTSNETQQVQIAVTTPYHPTPVNATININIALNQITVADKEINFFTEDGSASKSVAYTTQNTITPVYSLSGTCPSGITFDTSTGTFTYDGITTTPASGSVQVTVSSSTGSSAPDSGTFTLKLIEGSSPFPQGVWLHCPCKDGSTFECENDNVTMGQTGTPNFYTAAQEGRDCMEITNVNEYATATFKNIYFNGCYSGSSPIPTLDQSRSVAYWIKFPSNSVFYTGHGQGIFDYGYASQWQDFRNGIVGNATSNPSTLTLTTDNYNGLPNATYSVGTSTDIDLTNVWTDYGWHLITITYDHDTHTWCSYLDGTLTAQCVFSQELSTARTAQGPLVIGLGSPSRAGHTKQAGAVSFRISDFRLWRRALTDAEVQKLLNS